jgi:hypothetical protein
MATSPSDPVPPEVIAIAVAVAVAMAADEAAAALVRSQSATVASARPDGWRWEAWDS